MKRWAVVIGYTLLIYASLPFARTWQQFLREKLGADFNLTFNFFILSIGILTVFSLSRKVAKTAFWSSMGVLLVLVFLAAQMPIPEERMHLLQYAVLGYLISWAFQTTGALVTRIAWVICLGALIGLGDEAIQWVLPSRVFDWWDVGYNVTGITFGAALFQILK